MWRMGICRGKGVLVTNQPEIEYLGLSLLLILALSSPVTGGANQVVGLARKRRSGPEEG